MIQIEGLHKSFGNKAVLRGIDLRAATGQSLTVIGGSGSGKSVLLKCVLGLIAPDSGRVVVDGTPLTARTRPAFFDSFGMLFQGSALFDSLPVWQNVAFRLLHAGMPRRQARAVAEAKLARVGLAPDTADRFPAELSGGMQKRAALARAIAADPKVIFFDEPTTGLDPILAGTINALIRDIVTESGATTLTISHDMSTVRTVSDHVAMLYDGRIHWQGPIADLDRAEDPHVAQFIHGTAQGPIPSLG